uniref:CHK kinase-like domain-containing protein n=1 Tax=Stomoxys calcitrans TaxID=35570 RepID=A0A1I8Q0R0_STOCA
MAAGEVYATLVLKVRITIELQDFNRLHLSYILKVAPDKEELAEIYQYFFNTETAVYNEVIPELEEMYRQVGLNIQFSPKIFQLGPEVPSLNILLEDLNIRNFKHVNRLEGLDLEHTQAVLRKLAQFHAASAFRVIKKGSYDNKVTPDMDNHYPRYILNQMVDSFTQPFLKNLTCCKNGGKYKDVMKNFMFHAVEKIIRARKPHPYYFNALNHGDCWSNNILFKYSDDGKVEDLLFIDFQNTNYGSPAQDLFYFIITSTLLFIITSNINIKI